MHRSFRKTDTESKSMLHTARPLIVGSLLALVLAACAPEEEGILEPADDALPEEADEDETDEDTEDAAPDAADVETFTLRYSAPVASDSDMAQMLDWWADRVNELSTEAHLEIDAHWGGSLVPPTEVLHGLGAGTLDTGHVGGPYTPGDLPLTQVVGIPFITTDAEASARAFAELYEESDAFRAEWDDNDVRVLAWYITTGASAGYADEVNSLDDLQGTRLRSIGLIAEALSLLDVDTQAIAFPEIYESVDRGVVDGFSGLPFALSVNAGMHEVAPHYVDLQTGTFAISALVGMSEATWETLPGSLQDAMVQAGREVLDAAVEIHANEDAQACDQFLEAGGTITAFPEDELADWVDAAQAHTAELWLADTVEAGIDEGVAEQFYQDYVQAVASFEGTGEYEDGLQACASR